MSATQSFISPLAPIITRFLALKESLGRGYASERRFLHSLDSFLGHHPCASDLTPETFASWCTTLQHLTPTVRRNRMRVVRNLCLYRRRVEPECFVPEKTLFPRNHQAVQPYIFSEAQIARLLRATRALRPGPCSPLRPQVLRLAVVLLFTTGLRRGELVRLTLGDYDPREHTLFVRASKFHKSRLLPLSPDGAGEVDNFLGRRLLYGAPLSAHSPLLWHGCGEGRGYTGPGLGQSLRALFRTTGIVKPNGRPPRTHDLRHSFAVNALLRWYRSGVDVQAKLPFLSAFMGHVSVASTEYYLRFTEQIATHASARFEKCFGTLVSPLPESTGGNP
ncbi:tyrosine-type recombinase/integrase [Acidobacteria bacterium AH-259-O06]|nr:tyrosine-type recombinase/integrase [Acidobacteria bacterium AH-259-O06]